MANAAKLHSKPLGIRLVCLLALLLAAPSVHAAATEYRIPLADGKVSAGALATTLGAAVGQPAPADPAALIDLSGDNGPAFVTHLVDTLGSQACAASVEGQTLIVKLDAALAYRDPVAARRMARVIAAGRAFRPAGDKNSYGIAMPETVTADKPLTLLIHGLDSRANVWDWMVSTMTQDAGWQPAIFTYPDDGPCVGAAELLADCLADVRLRHPKLAINLLAHSMGGLVSREYVEGPMYRPGMVERFVMIGPPNHGSPYTRWRWALEWFEHYRRCKQEGDWNWAKMKEDGDGEAGADMRADSPFLRQLNARGRREGVKYTIVAGNKNAVTAVAADWMAAAAAKVPDAVSNWWGVRQARAGLVGKADQMRQAVADTDGPVPVESARLDGVTDFQVIHADHLGLIIGAPPAAWDLIKARLKE